MQLPWSSEARAMLVWDTIVMLQQVTKTSGSMTLLLISGHERQISGEQREAAPVGFLSGVIVT